MEQRRLTPDFLEHDPVLVRYHLDLSYLPTVYVLATHLSIDERHSVEDDLSRAKAPLTYDIKEASLVLTSISKPRRVKSELQWKGVPLDETTPGEIDSGSNELQERKRRRLSLSNSESKRTAVTVEDPSNTASITEDETEDEMKDNSDSPGERKSNVAAENRLPRPGPSASVGVFKSPRTEGSEVHINATKDLSNNLPKENEVVVIKLTWLKDSLRTGECLSIGAYLIYKARKLPTENPTAIARLPKPVRSDLLDIDSDPLIKHESVENIMERAKSDPKPAALRYKNKYNRMKGAAGLDVVSRSFASSIDPTGKGSPQRTRPTHLLHQTTSEHDEAMTSFLPDMPDWVVQGKVYSCERKTPLYASNEDFIRQLKKIRLARTLTLDEIGVRAYSTSIASLSAYPHPIQSTREILALPGCDEKIARLFQEYHRNDGRIQAVAEYEADPALTVVNQFYEIWGVGPKTAREFYYERGWRDLDDVVEFGWKSLARVQQIGLKYYDDFQLKLSRAEVESITAVITKHAKLVTDTGIETVIVGGYRRGKPESGDVDIILSHRDQNVTCNLINRVISSLETEGWVTHTLTLNLTNTKRNQEPLPINSAIAGDHGFDTLDKALVVWQNSDWPTKKADLAANPAAKNPNPHRRVDIIISPWRTVGCAVAGWTSGTTFQRDLRRYAKHVKGWKFDSSGVWDRGTGRWVDLEGWNDVKTRSKTWQEAERRVFQGFGLVYREPWDRCTG